MTMSCNGSRYPFNNYWDAGKVGIIYVTDEEVRKNYNVKRISAKLREKVIEHLKAEVKTYDQYISGDVYGYTVEDKDGNQIDSCCGFYGHDNEESGLLDQAKPAIDSEIIHRHKTRQGKVKQLIKNHVPLLQRPHIIQNYPIS